MKLPWRRDTEPEYYVEARPKKPRETLTQTAEKLIQRRMKKDPDGYGLQAAERIKGIQHEAPKTLADFLRELREYKAAMREAGLETGENKSLFREILEVIPTVPQLLQQVRELQQAQGMHQVYSPASMQVRQQSQPQLQQPTQEPKADQQVMTLDLESLLPYLELEPADAIGELKQLARQGDGQASYWLGFLSNTSYEAIVALLTQLKANPQYSPYIEQILSDDRKQWVEKLLTEAKKAMKELKSEGK